VDRLEPSERILESDFLHLNDAVGLANQTSGGSFRGDTAVEFAAAGTRPSQDVESICNPLAKSVDGIVAAKCVPTAEGRVKAVSRLKDGA
jgi:hypothetical protein